MTLYLLTEISQKVLYQTRGCQVSESFALCSATDKMINGCQQNSKCTRFPDVAAVYKLIKINLLIL